jgi:hypothetical protein
VFEEDLRKLTDNQHLYEVVRIEGTKHPKLLKSYLTHSIKFETIFILINTLNLKGKYDGAFLDPIWNTVSNKISKYSPFLEIDTSKYLGIIRKYIQ